MKYKIEVWFRYVVNGEQEKDFEIHEVEADNEPQAKRIALKNYDNRSVIPFKTEVL